MLQLNWLIGQQNSLQCTTKIYFNYNLKIQLIFSEKTNLVDIVIARKRYSLKIKKK